MSGNFARVRIDDIVLEARFPGALPISVSVWFVSRIAALRCGEKNRRRHKPFSPNIQPSETRVGQRFLVCFPSNATQPRAQLF